MWIKVILKLWMLAYVQQYCSGSCVSSCVSIPDGNYQSCLSCEVYVSCAGGVLYDGRPCASTLSWDDNIKNCVVSSQTCSDTIQTTTSETTTIPTTTTVEVTASIIAETTSIPTTTVAEITPTTTMAKATAIPTTTVAETTPTTTTVEATAIPTTTMAKTTIISTTTVTETTHTATTVEATAIPTAIMDEITMSPITTVAETTTTLITNEITMPPSTLIAETMIPTTINASTDVPTQSLSTNTTITYNQTTLDAQTPVPSSTQSNSSPNLDTFISTISTSYSSIMQSTNAFMTSVNFESTTQDRTPTYTNPAIPEFITESATTCIVPTWLDVVVLHSNHSTLQYQCDEEEVITSYCNQGQWQPVIEACQFSTSQLIDNEYLTPVEGKYSVFVGTAAIIFLAAEITLMLLLDLSTYYKAFKKCCMRMHTMKNDSDKVQRKRYVRQRFRQRVRHSIEVELIQEYSFEEEVV